VIAEPDAVAAAGGDNFLDRVLPAPSAVFTLRITPPFAAPEIRAN
jgi:hypothetical protein